MPISIVSNKISIPDRGKAVADAVLRGIGPRPDHEEWQVYIFEPIDRPEYVITIQGPSQFRWKQAFIGSAEQTLEFIQEKVRRATRYTHLRIE